MVHFYRPSLSFPGALCALLLIRRHHCQCHRHQCDEDQVTKSDVPRHCWTADLVEKRKKDSPRTVPRDCGERHVRNVTLLQCKGAESIGEERI
jgi:hypothetical protein